MQVTYNDYTPDSIVQTIVENFVSRAKTGEKKYGKTLDRTDLLLEDYLNHALEEHMDAILYLQKALKTIKDSQSSHSIENENKPPSNQLSLF